MNLPAGREPSSSSLSSSTHVLEPIIMNTLMHAYLYCVLYESEYEYATCFQVPSLTNQVLLCDLLLDKNGLSSLTSLSQSWLPCLSHLGLSENRYEIASPTLPLSVSLTDLYYCDPITAWLWCE